AGTLGPVGGGHHQQGRVERVRQPPEHRLRRGVPLRHRQSRVRASTALIAIGATTSGSPTIHSSEAIPGRCSGSAAAAPTAGALPHSCRTAWTTEDRGFHSATGRSHSGIGSGGANVLATNVSGKVVVNMTPLTASMVLSRDPTTMPIQIMTNPKPNNTRYPSSASMTPEWIRQPTMSPVSDITTTPIEEWMMLEALRAMRIDERRMGRVRKRSMIPLLRSLHSPE